MKKYLILILSAVTLFSCGNNTEKAEVTADSLFQQQDSVLAVAAEYSDSIEIKYAKGLKVEYVGDSIRITICNPDPSARHSKSEVLMIANGEQQKSKTFICTTALQLGNFEVLALEDRIVGMNSLKNLFSPRMKAQMKSGKTIKIGKEGNFDVESVIASRPDYIFVSASKHGGFEALKECGIPLVSHHGYKEGHPLGQAEWIKLIGLLTGETRRANAVFADIETKYNKLKDEVTTYCTRMAEKDKSDGKKGSEAPTIASGRQLRDGWYIVGGRSYMAQIFKDAGARYIYDDNEESGGVTLDFEAAFSKSASADYWVFDSAFDGDFTLTDLAAEDARYAELSAYKNGNVIFCNLTKTPYRELAGVQPQYLLADIVKVVYPDILEKYVPKYYKLIK